MEPEGSLPHSQQPTTCPYPGPDRSSPYPPFLYIHFNIILPSTPRFPSGIFPSGNPTKSPYAHLLFLIRAICLAHLILLDLNTVTISGEDYRS